MERPPNLDGSRSGLEATTTSTGTQAGSSYSRLALSKSFGGDGDFIGVIGTAESTALSNSNSNFSTVVGGDFSVSPNTSIALGGGMFWVAGMKATLDGAINTTPGTGAVSAVIGIDNNQGTAQSWAGYFDGDGYFSDTVAIGLTTFPNMATGFSPAKDVSTFRLFVKGGILTEDVVIDDCTNWADYVFAEDYDLNSLEEVEATINDVGHLPNIPSAEEVAANGFSVKDMMVSQQEKIEETVPSCH